MEITARYSYLFVVSILIPLFRRSPEEFAVLLTDDRLRSFLSAMEIDATDLQGLFEVLGDGSGNISAAW